MGAASCKPHLKMQVKRKFLSTMGNSFNSQPSFRATKKLKKLLQTLKKSCNKIISIFRAIVDREEMMKTDINEHVLVLDAPPNSKIKWIWRRQQWARLFSDPNCAVANKRFLFRFYILFLYPPVACQPHLFTCRAIAISVKRIQARGANWKASRYYLIFQSTFYTLFAFPMTANNV